MKIAAVGEIDVTNVHSLIGLHAWDETFVFGTGSDSPSHMI